MDTRDANDFIEVIADVENKSSTGTLNQDDQSHQKGRKRKRVTSFAGKEMNRSAASLKSTSKLNDQSIASNSESSLRRSSRCKKEINYDEIIAVNGDEE